MKKFILLTLWALLPMVSFAIEAEIDGLWYSIVPKAKVAEVIQYKNNQYYSGNIVIPASIEYEGTNYDVTTIVNSAFYRCSGLTSITIPESVTSIGNSVFYGCSSLTSITIPESVTSIGNYAFCNCSGLTSITIPNNVTSIGDYNFYNCIGLTSVTIPDSVTNIGNSAFSGCSGLTSITIPNSVTSIGDNAFLDCSSLTSVHITNLSTWCKVSFAYGSNPLSYAHHLYLNDEEIKNLVIPDDVTAIGDLTFAGCSSLTSVTIPNSVTSIGNYAFRDCTGLTSITIPNSVTSIGNYAFSGCSSLTSATIGNSVTTIGGSAFSGCSALTSITIPESVTYIDYYAFGECKGLTSVHITNLSAWCNITFYSVSNPLYYAHHLYLNDEEIKDLVIPDDVTAIGDATFYGCSGLTSITIPNSVTNIGYYAFCGCDGLTSITIPNSVTSIGAGAFNSCSSLKSVILGNSVASIGGSAFYSCTSLTSVTIPNSVTSIGSSAFYNCSGLTSATIGNSVTSIGDETFYGCTSLTSITIPNSVTSIGYYAFQGCSALTSVTIGNGVKSIESKAFADCQELANVYCYAENVPTKNRNTNYPSTDIFEDSYIQYATLHVPAASIEKYKTTAPWSRFGSIVSINGDDPGPNIEPEPEKCATPTISYSNGELTFNCETEGVEFVSEITDSDIKKNYTAKIQLNVTYNLTVYATKAEYENSDTIQATLCWIDAEPRTEGLQEDAIMAVKALPILIQTQGGTITIQGTSEGTPIVIYSIDGKKYGSAIAKKDSTTISTTLQSGSVAVVKIGEKAVKVLLK